MIKQTQKMEILKMTNRKNMIMMVKRRKKEAQVLIEAKILETMWLLEETRK